MSFALPVTADAISSKKVKRYSSCKVLRKSHPHGIAKSAATSRAYASAQSVAAPKVDSKVYLKNARLDRDNDFVICGDVGSSSSTSASGSQSNAPTTTPSKAPSSSGGVSTPSATPSPSPSESVVPGSFAGSGTFAVGTTVAPGTYRSSGTGYWERLNCATGAFECILSNNNASGQEYVTILPTDRYFSTTRMSRWVPESSLSAQNATSFSGSGMYKVGFDIQPGTYQSSGQSSNYSGYWERLSCATGELDCILANDNNSGSTIVTILPSDAYFRTVRNLTWTKIG